MPHNNCDFSNLYSVNSYQSFRIVVPNILAKQGMSSFKSKSVRFWFVLSCFCHNTTQRNNYVHVSLLANNETKPGGRTIDVSKSDL